MKRLIARVAAAAVTCGVAQGASAADALSVPIDSHGWTGVTVGVRAGVGSGVGETDTDGGPTPPGSPSSVHFGEPAPSAGVFIGYDHEIVPGFVLGVEADASWIGAEVLPADPTTAEFMFRNNWTATVTGRVGVEVSPKTLLYAKGGYASINAEASDQAGVFIIPEETQLDGYTAGGGIETMLSDRFSLRVEGTYTAAFDEFTPDSEFGPGSSYSYRPSNLAVSVGFAYRTPSPNGASKTYDAEPTRSWSGVYAGGHVGGLSSSTANGNLISFTGEFGPVSTTELGYGGYAGGNLQVGDRWVIGLEADVTFSETEWDIVGQILPFPYAKSDHQGSVSARLGYLPVPNTMIYARAGAGLMHIEPSEVGLWADVGAESDYIQTANAGVGVETMITPNLLLRAEGVYTSALEQYRFPAGGSDLYVEPSSVEARVGTALFF